MTITLEIRPELQARLARQAAAQGVGVDTCATSLLEQAAGLPEPESHARTRTPSEIRTWLDELASLSDKIPPRPGETFPRDMIYQDHP